MTIPPIPLMPLPAQWQPGVGQLPINGGFTVGVCGARNPLVQQAVVRFVHRLAAETGLILPNAASPADCAKATLVIDVQRAIALPQLGDDESYTLEITPEAAHLTAPTSTGMLRGLATFEQAVQPGPVAFSAAALSIQDRPRFPWRGFMLDAARHWMPIAVVERNLDGMAAVKLNVFHWHLSDDQGFRVESRIFPKLQGEGSDGNFYTQEQVRQVVRYAAERGIRVVPEFDMPGHATSWVTAYPELASAPGPYKIGRKWGVYDETLDPTRESTYRFLERLIGEMTALFPDPYFHIGGDEVTPTQWKANPAIQRFMSAHAFTTPEQLQAYFNRRMEAILLRHGKKMIGWDEILSPDLPATSVIQSWRGQASLAAAARGGHRGLLSSGYYLDHMNPASFHYANDPLSGDAKTLTPEQAALILGGEACMWTEYADAETVDSRIWPRLAAIAERLWSPANTTDVTSMYDRLDIVSRKLEWLGLQHRSAQARLLERIAEYSSSPGLTTLASSVEAAGIHERYPAHTYNSLEPLNRLVDAAVAESETVRRLTADARAFVAASGNTEAEKQRLRGAFAQWRRLPEELAPLSTMGSGELAPVADALAHLGETGEQALGYLEKHETPPPGWLAAQQGTVAAASKLTSEVHIAPVRVISVLLAAFNAPANP
jgi:hexosaminidase